MVTWNQIDGSDDGFMVQNGTCQALITSIDHLDKLLCKIAAILSIFSQKMAENT